MEKKIKFSVCDCEVEKGKFDINNIPLECKSTWELISGGHTTGVFQLETRLGKDWAKKVKPKNINELSDLISILRPGCLESGLADEYVDIKFGKKAPEYLHPCLKPILESTNGVMVYQEQLLKIANEIAGFSLEESDSLRKAVGKKDVKLMSQMKEKFAIGSARTGLVNKEIAEEIFGWIEKSQRYSFNKSHSMAYAMISYQTAYLKTHFPHEFFCSYLTYSKYKGDPKEEIYNLVQDARLFGIDIFPPSVKRKNIHFKIIEDNSKGIAFGLSHIRGVGQSAIKKIIEKSKGELDTWNKFLSSVPDFHRNVGISLVKSGACDCYQKPRNEMVRELEIILGNVIRDKNGNQLEEKGLTDKEKEIFFKLLSSNNDIPSSLKRMLEISSKKPLKSLKKEELIELARKQNIQTEGLKKEDVINLLIQSGYEDFSASEKITSARIPIIENKIEQLKEKYEDTFSANAIAEKEFLGIQLTCSAVDDVLYNNATHLCVEAAREGNNRKISICAIIDNIKHTKTKRGKNIGSPMCFLTISDSTYCIDRAVVFPDAYENLKDLCKKDLICIIYGYKKDGSFIINNMKKII